MPNKTEYIQAKLDDITEHYEDNNLHNICIRQIKSDNNSFILPIIYSYKERLKKYKFVKFLKSSYPGQLVIRIFFKILLLYEYILLRDRVVYNLRSMSDFC